MELSKEIIPTNKRHFEKDSDFDIGSSKLGLRSKSIMSKLHLLMLIFPSILLKMV